MTHLSKVLAFFTILSLSACAPFWTKGPPPTPPKTQLEIREIQTRSYESKDSKSVMKAVINALQDEGFLIRSADKELGYISASKEMDIEDSTEVFLTTLFSGVHARYKKNSQVEASANITEFGKTSKVRVVFQVKNLDNFNMPISTSEVQEPAFYQAFFSKVDKSIFIEKQGL